MVTSVARFKTVDRLICAAQEVVVENVVTRQRNENKTADCPVRSSPTPPEQFGF